MCSVGTNVHGKVGKNIEIVSFCFVSSLNYSHKSGQVYVVYVTRVIETED